MPRRSIIRFQAMLVAVDYHSTEFVCEKESPGTPGRRTPGQKS
jgi:hypothetical protein